MDTYDHTSNTGISDRRGAARIAVNGRVGLTMHSVEIIGISHDISWTGICIATAAPCACGEEITISLPLPDGSPFRRAASIQWCRFDAVSNSYIFGSRFV